MPEIIKTEIEKNAIIKKGQGYIFNDTWWELHKASCHHIKRMKIPLRNPYNPMMIDPPNCSNGPKLYWNDSDNRQVSLWLDGHRRGRGGWGKCSNCRP